MSLILLNREPRGANKLRGSRSQKSNREVILEATLRRQLAGAFISRSIQGFDITARPTSFYVFRRRMEGTARAQHHAPVS